MSAGLSAQVFRRLGDDGENRRPGALIVMNAESAAPVVDAYEEWLRELRRYVHRLTGDPDMAEDVAQEAVMRFVRTQQSTAVRTARAWLYRTATNLVRDHARHEAMRQRKLLPEDDVLAETPEHDFERSEAIRQVQEVLARIPERDRELLILRESGFRYREIAEVIGVKTESVPVLAARALERFRAAYVEVAER
jgi:RNA polymerase sigma factor (sigma-70 family)